MDSFTLEGERYYAEGRKCSKANCKCHDGKLHGPYWYARNLETGRRRYIGRQLPDDVRAALAGHRENRVALVADIRELEGRLAVLWRLHRHEALSDVDKIMLRNLGYGKCLV